MRFCGIKFTATGLVCALLTIAAAGEPYEVVRGTATKVTPSPMPGVAYSNTDGAARFGFPYHPTAQVGDDVTLIGRGLLSAVRLSIYNPDDVDPNDCMKSSIESVDATVIITRQSDNVEIGRFTRTLVFGTGDDALPPGQFSYWTLSDLAGENIVLDQRDLVLSVRFTNLVWADPGCIGFIGQAAFFDPNGCATGEWTSIMNPAGISRDTFAINGALGWFLGGCPWVANFYWELSVEDLERFPTTVDRRPEFPVPAATYWFNPAVRDFGGGYDEWRSDLPDPVIYEVGFPYVFATDPHAVPGHECLGWVMRKLDGTSERDYAYTTTPPGIVASAYSEIVMLFETSTYVSAVLTMDDIELALAEPITIGKTDPNDPAGPLLEYLDRAGLGDGVTPLTRRYSPVQEFGDYETELITFEAAEREGATVGWQFTRWDGSTIQHDGRRTTELEIHRYQEGKLVYEISDPPCLLPGDTNCDGWANNGDIDSFIFAVTDGQAAWLADLVDRGVTICDFDCAADLNGDGWVNNGDIEPFIDLISGQ